MATPDAPEYGDVTRNRLRSIAESGGYEFDEDERTDVENRLRRMFYGARVEGSKAEPRSDDAEPDAPETP